MERVPEPEVMDDPGQAAAYARADFSSVNAGFVAGLKEAAGGELGGPIVDLGCGPGDIPVRIARAFPTNAVVAVDAAGAMLQLARERIRSAGVGSRVVLVRARIPRASVRSQGFGAVVSNSLVHHLPDPLSFWETVLDLARPGAVVHVMDLRRPASPEAARRLVEREAAGEDPLLQRDFFHSLLAAFTPEEIRRQLPEPLARLGCREAGDRHWLVSGRLSL